MAVTNERESSADLGEVDEAGIHLPHPTQTHTGLVHEHEEHGRGRRAIQDMLHFLPQTASVVEVETRSIEPARLSLSDRVGRFKTRDCFVQ